MNKGTYLGQLTLTLGHFADGWPVRKVYQLRGFDKLTGMDKIEKFDRGERGDYMYFLAVVDMFT